MILVLVSVAVLVAGALHAYAVSPPIQADCIYIVMLLSDLVRQPHVISWWLPPANGFFPDVLFGAAGYALGLHGFNDTVFEHAVFCLWILLTSYVWLRAAKIAALPSIAAAVLALALFDLLDPPASTLSWTLMTPTAHDGIIGFELLAAAAYFRSSFVALFCAVAIGVFSDRIMLAHFVAPIGFLAGVAWLVTRKRAELVAIAVMAAGTFAGWAALGSLNFSGVFETASIPYLMHFRFGRAQLADVFQHLGSITGWTNAAIYALSYFVLIGMLVATPRRPPHARLLAAAALMSTAALLTPIVGQIWVDSTAIRYQLPFFLLPLLVVVAILLNELRASEPRIGRRVCATVGAVALASAIVTNESGFEKAPGAEQRFVAGMVPLTAQLTETGTSAVMAQYWMAKPLLFVSNYNLKVCQITNDGDIYPWIADVGWCVDADEAMRNASAPVAFVDYGNSLDPAALDRRYGMPQRVTDIGGQRVYYYSPQAVEPQLRRSLCRMVPALHCKETVTG